jgi:exo-1,4-beta-D-glucosaminidase
MLAENFYWDSPKLDVLKKYIEMDSEFKQYADLTALDGLPAVKLEADAAISELNNEVTTKIKLTNPTDSLAFFIRVEVTRGRNGEEVLPVFYNNNYFSLFPDESINITGRFNYADLEGNEPYIRVEGYNVDEAILQIDQ